MIFNVVVLSVNAQSPLSAAEIQSEFQSRGLSEQEVQEFLSSRGLTTEDLQNISPSEYITLNEAFNEYISQKRKEGVNQVAKTPVEEVKKEVFVDTTKANNIPVSASPSKPITIYGEQLFKEGNFPLLSGEGLVPGTYILDVGDEVAISIFGYSKMSKIFTINQNGAILYNNQQQRVVVAGLSLNEAKVKLEKVFQKTYSFKPGEFTVNVIGARTITVSIYGEVKNSGGYILSAVNSPVNAIQAAGGITKNGSYRNIRIFKNNGEVHEIDLYKYLNNPAQFKEIGLSNNDVIQVPTRNATVKIDGAIVRPLQYEIRKGESFNDLVSYAGGFKSGANLNSIELKRFVQAKLSIVNIDYNSSLGKSFKLENGDQFNVFTLSENIENLVTVEGAINNPGTYELKTNMRLSDLMRYIIFNEESKLDVALIKRKNTDGSPDFIKVNLAEVMENVNSQSNVKLQNNDELLIWNLQRFVDSQNDVSITGAIKYPGSYPYKKGETYLSDIVYFAGGLRRDASKVGMIYRKDPLNNNAIEYIRINPNMKANSAEDILIMPFDSIVIIENETNTRNYSVSIEGKVNQPGNFKYGEEMTLKDLVVLAGGFELSAYTNEVEISRLIIENNKSTEVKVATVSVNPDLSINGEGANYVLQPFDKVYVRAVSEFENQTTVRLIGQVKYPGNYVLLDKNEKLSSVIKRAGGLTKEAFQEGARLNREYNDVGLVVMNLDQAMKFDNSRFNYILKPNDEIIIPKQEDIVTIQSSLIKRSRNATDVDESLNVDLNMLSVAHLPNKRADYYIGKYAGGFDEKADRKNLYVNHPNGELAETRNYGLFRLYPKVRKGSVIIIPDLPLETEEDKKNQDVDWNQLLSDSVSQAMTIVTLLLLIERI